MLRPRTVRPFPALTRRRGVEAALFILVGSVLVSAPASTQDTAAERPHFEYAEVDLAAVGSYSREAADLPPVTDPATGTTLQPTTTVPDLTTGGDNPGSPDDRQPGPGWSAAAELPIEGQFVVLEWEGEPEATFQVRSRNSGSWSDWVVAHAEEDERPDADEPGFDVNAVGPIFVGEDAEAVEVSVFDGAPDDLSMTVMESVEPTGYRDATPTAPQESNTLSAFGSGNGVPNAPVIYTRANWGAGGWAYGNPGCEDGPRAASSLRFAVVHHTVSTNDYSPAQADDQIRAIYDYHVNSRGWCDIAYNFVVDKYGSVWEGRSGSTSASIQGGHAQGFNLGSVGVVLLGQYHPGSEPPAATVSSAQYAGVRDLIAWKFGLNGVNALGTTTEVSGGSSSIPAGTVVTLKTIIGHRDVGSTGCPGDNAYVLLPSWRNDVAAKVAAAPPAPSRPAAASNKDGRLEVFAVAANGQVTHGWQQKPTTGPWVGWYEMGGFYSGGVSAQENADGRIELFTRTSTGQIRHAWQTTPNGIWSSFVSMGGTAKSDPAVSINKDGRLEAYYTGTDGRIYHSWQVAPGSYWSGWYSLGGLFANAPAAGENKDGRQELVVIGLDGQVFHSWQQTPNGGWSPWYSMGGKFKGDAFVATNADGRLEIFALAPDGSIWHNWQWAPNGTGGWSGFLPLGGQFTGGPGVGRNADGRLEVIEVGLDGRLWHMWQEAGGAWSAWHVLSTPIR